SGDEPHHRCRHCDRHVGLVTRIHQTRLASCACGYRSRKSRELSPRSAQRRGRARPPHLADEHDANRTYCASRMSGWRRRRQIPARRLRSFAHALWHRTYDSSNRAKRRRLPFSASEGTLSTVHREPSTQTSFGVVAVTLAGNLLAHETRWGQVRSAMSTFARSKECRRAVIATFISAASFWTVVVSVSPQLHARIHADANHIEHVCAITLIASGSYEQAGQPAFVGGPQFSVPLPGSAELTSSWVKPLFLNAHIFAHAPPAHS